MTLMPVCVCLYSLALASRGPFAFMRISLFSSRRVPEVGEHPSFCCRFVPEVRESRISHAQTRRPHASAQQTQTLLHTTYTQEPAPAHSRASYPHPNTTTLGGTTSTSRATGHGGRERGRAARYSDAQQELADAVAYARGQMTALEREWAAQHRQQQQLQDSQQQLQQSLARQQVVALRDGPSLDTMQQPRRPRCVSLCVCVCVRVCCACTSLEWLCSNSCSSLSRASRLSRSAMAQA